MSDLKDLTERLKEENVNVPHISVSLSGNSLEFELDFGIGLEGYESVNVVPSSDLFNICYFALFQPAFKTFLDEQHQQQINNSRLLTSFRDKVKSVREGKKVEVYDAKRDEFYSQLINLSERAGYGEIDTALSFFSNAFRKKALAYKAEAGAKPASS